MNGGEGNGGKGREGSRNRSADWRHSLVVIVVLLFLLFNFLMGLLADHVKDVP